MIALGRVTAQIVEKHVTIAAIRALDRPLEMSWKQEVEILMHGILHVPGHTIRTVHTYRSGLWACLPASCV